MPATLPRAYIEKRSSWRVPSIARRYVPTKGEVVLDVLAEFGRASMLMGCAYGMVPLDCYITAEKYRREYEALKRIERQQGRSRRL